jgi:site-specific recombinase XerD
VNHYAHVAKRALYRDSVAVILKRAAKRAQMKTKPIAGHSLRSGMVTEAAMNGVSEFVIMKQQGIAQLHCSSAMCDWAGSSPRMRPRGWESRSS